MIAGFAYDNGLGSLGLTPVQESRRLGAEQRRSAALAQRQSRAASRQAATAQRQAAHQAAAAQRQAAAQARQAAAKLKATVRKQEAQTKQAGRKATAQAKKDARIAKKVGGKTVQATPEDAKKLDQLTAKRDELKKKIADAKAALALKRKKRNDDASVKGWAGNKNISGLADVDEFGNEIGDSSLSTGSITPVDQPTVNTGSTATSIAPTPPSLFGGTSPDVLALMAPKNLQKHLASGRLNAKDTQYLFMQMTMQTQQQTQELLQEILSLNQQLMELLSQLAIVDDSATTADTGTGMTQLMPAGTIFMDESGNMVQGDIQPLQNQTFFPQPFQQAPAFAQQQYMPTVDDSGGYGIAPLAQQPQYFQQPLPTASFQPQYDESMPTLEEGGGDISSYFSQGSMIVGADRNLPVVNDAPDRGYEEAGASGEDVSLDQLVSGDGDVAMFNEDWMGLDYGDLG